MEKHIVRSYDEDIDGLNSGLSAMGTSCEWQLSKAIKAMETEDLRLAQEVVRADRHLNTLCREVEEKGVKLIAKRTPLAGDLRFILTAMRTGSELERIGDYAAGIARRVMELNGAQGELNEPVALIREISKLCRQMISDIVAAFIDQDIDAAIEIWHSDDVVDRKFARLMTDLRGQMQQGGETALACTQLIFIGRCLERIGDHITNIAEGIYYTQTGETYIGTLES